MNGNGEEYFCVVEKSGSFEKMSPLFSGKAASVLDYKRQESIKHSVLN